MAADASDGSRFALGKPWEAYGRCALCRIGFWRTAIRLFAGFFARSAVCAAVGLPTTRRRTARRGGLPPDDVGCSIVGVICSGRRGRAEIFGADVAYPHPQNSFGWRRAHRSREIFMKCRRGLARFLKGPGAHAAKGDGPSMAEAGCATRSAG